MTKQKFDKAGKLFPGQPPIKPTPMQRARHKLWQEWHRYGRIKLAAAVGGNVNVERDATVDSLYRGKHKTVADVKMATVALHDINESLSEFHSVIVDHKLVDDALAILITTGVRGTPLKFRKATPAEIRKREKREREHQAKIDSMMQCKCSVHYDGNDNRLSPEAFQKRMAKLVTRKREGKRGK